MKKIELARALNISTRCLRKHVARGMPTNSLEAAKYWRSARLEIRQTKAHRMGGNNGGKESKNLKQKPEVKTIKKQNRRQKEFPLANRNPTLMDLESTDANTLFLSARASKERSLAKRSEIEVGILRGELLKRDEVERAVFNAGRLLRDQLINLSSRIAPELYEQTSIARLESRLAEEIHQILETTSKKLL